MPSPPERLLHEALLRVERAYNAAGITSVIDPGLSPREIGAYRSPITVGQPTVHASLMWAPQSGFWRPGAPIGFG